MSWLVCCIQPRTLGESCVSGERPSTIAAGKTSSPSKAPICNSPSVGLAYSLDQGEELSVPRPLVHAPSSRVRKPLRLSEESTLASCPSTTPTSLNPLAYVFPFANDDTEDFSVGHFREEVDSLSSNPPPGQPRTKVEFADLCGSLEDLLYLGEGSNGVVYSASWHGARVAVKFLLGSSDDRPHLQRCHTEAVLTRVLSHPCVVQCFATAIAQLTPEVWEAIRARCRRHQSVLQSSFLGRSVAAAVQQQEMQERRASQDARERHLREQQQRHTGDRCYSLQNLRSQSSLLQSRTSPSPHLLQQPQLLAQSHLGAISGAATCRRQRQQHQQDHQQDQRPLQAVQSLSYSQDRPSAGQPVPTLESSCHCALPDYDKMSTAFSEVGVEVEEDVSSAEPRRQPQQAPTSPTSPTSPSALPPPPPQPQPFRNLSLERPRAPPPPPPRAQSGRRGSSELSGEQEAARGADDGPEPCGGEGGGGGVGVLDALEELRAQSGRHCTLVVMEYMDAGTLHTAIVRGDFSARRSSEHRSRLLALLLTAQELAQGMAHLHALDILHGDLKPTNVLLKASPCRFTGPAAGPQPPGAGGGSAGVCGGGGGLMCADPRGYTAKIADLGLARPCGEEAAALSSDQWGALAYLAPEAAKGSCCKASDVYSFGVMLWEMSAGVRPYLGLTAPQVLMGLISGTLRLTWPSDGSLYSPLRSLAVACADLNPAERPTFELAARILGRMVRHIRSAAEPLRQRHSSALSIETANAAAAAAAAASGGSPAARGGGGGGGSGGGKVMLHHDSMSMSSYTQGAAGSVAAGAPPTGSAKPTSSSGCEAPAKPQGALAPVSGGAGAATAAAAAGAALRSGSDGGGGLILSSTSPPQAPPMPRLPPGPGVWTASSAAGVRATGGGDSAPTAADATSGNGNGNGVSGTFWNVTVGPKGSLPYTFQYPRTRLGGGGGVCGSAVPLSPRGGEAGGGAAAPDMGLKLPCDSAAGGSPPAAPLAAVAEQRRPGSSPAHAHDAGALRC